MGRRDRETSLLFPARASGARPDNLCTAIDIKAREKSEDDLRRSEEKFKDFAENLQAITYTYDSQGKFTYANKVCEEVSGFSRNELPGMNFIQLIHDDYKESIAVKYPGTPTG